MKNLKTQTELLEEILSNNGHLAEASGIAQAWAEMLGMDAEEVDGGEKDKLLRVASKFEEINRNLAKVMKVIRTNSIDLLYGNHE